MMMRRSNFSPLVWGLVVLAGGAVLAGSCAKPSKLVDPSYTTPEGTPSGSARLVIWPERPNILAVFKDVAPPGEGDEDEFQGFVTSEEAGVGGRPAGTINGMVLDNTAARGFQIFRRETNGGLRQLYDFTLEPATRWPDGHWELYKFFDTAPTSSPSYIGRGLVGGEVTSASPVTNEASLPTDTLYNIDLSFVNDTQDLQSPVTCPDPHNRPCHGNDSTVTWQPVPGATRYLVQIYRQGEGGGNDIILSGRPALIAADQIHFFVVGETGAPIRFGINQVFGGASFTELRTPHVGEYLIRVSAIGAHGELRGTSFVQCESFATVLDADDATLYAKFPLGAVRLPHISLNEPEKKSCSNRNANLAAAYRTLLAGSSSSSMFRTRAFMLPTASRFAGHRWVLKD